MKNYIQPGETLRLTAPSGGVLAGVGYLVGSIFSIATAPADSGQPFEGYRGGVFDLAKQAGAGVSFAQGGRVSWDATNRRCVAPGTGAIPIGSAVQPSDASASTVRVVLDAIATAAA